MKASTSKSKYGDLKRRKAQIVDITFNNDAAFAKKQGKLNDLKAGADVAANLAGVRDVLKRSVKDGGVDRGGAKGTGGFKKVLEAMKGVESRDEKGKYTREAIKELVKEAESWLKEDKKELAKDPEREKDPVTVRKRQCAEAIMLHARAEQKISALHNAPDWKTYEEAAREAETAVRNCQAASLTMKKPPERRTGGDSDTYKILNQDGSVAYFFKPLDGEAVAPGWGAKGGGAAREVLVCEFGDQMKQMGFDFQLPKITEASLTSLDFTQGTNSQSIGQTGVVIDAINGQDGAGVIKTLQKLTPNQVKAFKQSIPTEDVHNIVVLDFLTLNMDRHQGNIMFDVDMDGNGNVQGPTKMTPIDAGNMLPPETVFNAVSDFGAPLSEGMVAPIASDGAVPVVGKNMLMQLPQSKEPFDQTMIDKIKNLDPKTVAGAMKGSDAKRQGAMAGKIGNDTFQLVEESVHFLKLVVGQDPPPMVYTIGWLYAMDEGFKAFKTARRQLIVNLPQGRQLDESTLKTLVSVATAKAEQVAKDEIQAAADREEYAAVGGDGALSDLGWGLRGANQTMTIAQKLDAIKKQTTNPAAVQERDQLIQTHNITRNQLPSDYDTVSFVLQLIAVQKLAEDLTAHADVQKRGGDQEIGRILAAIRGAGATPDPDKPATALTWKDKVQVLNRWADFDQLGGYAAYNAAVSRGMPSNPTNFSDQISALTEFQKEQAMLQAAEAAGGEQTFNALKAAVAHLNFTSARLKKEYKDLNAQSKKDLTEAYNAIKGLPAFRNYQQLVANGELKATTDFDVFLRQVKNYQAKG